MVYSIEMIRTKIIPITQKYQIPAVYLFGSYARGTATENSDIDLLIDTMRTSLTSLFALGALHCELEDALEKPVDLITLNSLEQQAQMLSEEAHRDTILKERVGLYTVV